MDLNKLLSIQEKCINDNPPACITQCPIHIDVKGFIEEIKKGNFEESYRILQKRMPFTRIIGQICDHPCENHCETSGNKKAISIHELEKAVVAYGKEAKIKSLPIPKINKNIAAIGAGISGITCAMDLNAKGYNVTIFEKENKLGGSLLKKTQITQEDIHEIERLGIEIKLNNEITAEKFKNVVEEYDAVFIGTGIWNEKLDVNKETLQTQNKKVFTGGKIVTENESVIQSVYTGRQAAVSIDRFVHNKSLTALREKEGPYKSKLEITTESDKILPRLEPENDIFTKEEAMREASRCLQCECHRCVKACVHLQKAKLDPKAYIRMINQNERIILGDHYGNKTINSCTECGLCGTVCPAGIDMSEIIRETRQSMVVKGKMPVSAHDFALKDMEFTNSKYFELIKHQPGFDSSKFVFYPGCQLSASYPDHVIKTYKYLMEKLDGGVGLYLGCCGAPADWAGRKDLYNDVVEKVKGNIKALGNLTIITACSTCFENFKNSLENVKIKSLWEIFDKEGLPEGTSNGNGKVLTIHDACSTRKENDIHESVRSIVKRMGYKVHEPDFTKETTKCCGFGGNLYFSNKALSREVSDERIKSTENDFLAYCAMCRDLFTLRGKNTYHILDLIFGDDKAKIPNAKVPTLSERRAGRMKLKKEMLEALWNEKFDVEDEYEDLNIIVSDSVRNKMEEQHILDGDIKKVIGHSESTKDSFFNPKNGHILGWDRLNNITFWVEYEKDQDAFKIVNAYSHRMEVKGV